MLKEKRIEIAFELANEFIFDKTRAEDQTAWCSGCGEFAPLISLQTAALLEKTTTVEIFRQAETGDLHHQATTEGALLICFSSLLDAGQSQAYQF